MRKTKRWLAFLLSLSMVLSVGTSPVLAASVDDPAQTAVEASAQAVPDAETEEQTEASKEETGEEETKAEGTKTEETKAEERKAEEAAGKAAEPAAGAAKDKGTDAKAEPQEPENKIAPSAAEETHSLLLGLETNDKVGLSPDFDENGETVVYWEASNTYFRTRARIAAAASGVTLTYTYTDIDGAAKTVKATSTTALTSLPKLIAKGAKGAEVTLTAASGSVSETYKIHVKRKALLSGLTLTDANGAAIAFTPVFSKLVTDYSVNVIDDVTSVKVKASELAGADGTAFLFNGTESADGTYDFPIQPGENKLTVSVKNGSDAAQEYTVTINQVSAVTLTVDLKTDGALFALYRGTKGKTRVIPEADGTYKLYPKEDYIYTVTAKGYQSYKAPKNEQDENGRNLLNISEDTIKSFTLEKTPESDPLTQYNPTYPGARCGEDNNSIVNVKTPINRSAIEVVWERQTGVSVSPSSGSTPIIAGSFMYTFSKNTIYKMDKETGNVVGSATTKAGAGFNLMPSTYGNGMIFVPINGGVQCFNADTMESLWVYTDPNGGSSNSPIRYSDGYIYFGLQGNGALVCISVEDEDPTVGDEAKDATWRNMDSNGNIWWNDVWSNENYVFVAASGPANKTDQGRLLCIDKVTGETVQSVVIDGGRSGVTYYNKRIYFISGHGKLYSFNIADDGTLDLENLIAPLELGGASVSTPVIYNNRLYIGWSTGGFGSKGALKVIKIDPESGAMSEAYSVSTNSYCQSSGVVTTAYEEETGYVYVYFMENSSKGSMYMIKDSADMTEPDPESGEFYCPSHPQYCIASVAVDEKGTMYMKNDSAWQFAIRNAQAYVTNLQVSGGNAVIDGGDTFDGSLTDHMITVDQGTENFTLHVTANDGTVITVNGKPCDSGEAVISMTDGKADVEVQLTNGDYIKTYHFSAMEGPVVKSLVITNNPNAGIGKMYVLDKEFDPGVTDYMAGFENPEESEANFWIKKLGSTDTIEVVSYDGLSSEPRIREDKRTGQTNVRCYFSTRTASIANVSLKISNQSGTQSKIYHFKLYTGDVLPLPEIADARLSDRTETTADITFTANKASSVYYLLEDPAAEAPDADTIAAGEKMTTVKGENKLTFTGLEKTTNKVVYLVMKDSTGAYSEVRSVKIDAYRKLGDLDGNEEISLTDAIMLLDLLTAGKEVSPLVGDINGDGVVNLTDAVALLDQVTENL